MDFFTAQVSAEYHQQELLREAENSRLVQQIQANQILTRWVLSLLRRPVSESSHPKALKPVMPKGRTLVRNGG